MSNGNTAAMREALGKIRAELWNNAVIGGKKKFALYEIADVALAAPPRNCDVGTAEEQFERWEVFCAKYDNYCTGCPCDTSPMVANCFAKWAQMDYKKEMIVHGVGGAK